MPHNPNAMKTLFYFSFLIFLLQITTKAQSIKPDSIIFSQSVLPSFHSAALQPVYFNYSRRQLFYNKTTRVNPKEFLQLCRTIHDPQIKNQIARYDQLTRNKKIITGTMIGTAITGYLLTMVAATMPGNTPYNYGYQYSLIFGGVACLLATPVLAITTSVPHQKRKEVLFRDLPDAYNFYVLNQSKK